MQQQKNNIFWGNFSEKRKRFSPLKKNAILYIDLKNGMIHLVICFSL